jgi:tyrosyl-tRNA synthetase
LTPNRTSPYAFYQFWINVADADVPVFLKTFSFRSIEEIESLVAEHEKDPGARAGQKALAEELTEMLHGKEGVREAALASQALFSGNVRDLTEQLLEEAFAGAPQSTIVGGRLDGQGIDIVELLVETAVAKSKREARQFLQTGAVTVNGDKVADDFRLTRDRLLYGSVALIRRGKKTWHMCRRAD